MRKLSDEELARCPAAPVFQLHERGPERTRAAAVVESLRAFMHEELALTPQQMDDLTLALERALLLHSRSEP